MPSNSPMQGVLDFLDELEVHNERAWFQANKTRYDAAHAVFVGVVDAILDELRRAGEVDDDTTAQDCLFRIYRDVRFSKEKTPYKTNFAALIGKGGRRVMGTSERGVYLHIQPDESFAGGGIHSPTSAQLAVIRRKLAEDTAPLEQVVNHEAFRAMFGALKGESLTRPPKGYKSDHPNIAWLKRKQFYAAHAFTNDDLLQADLPHRVVAVFDALSPLDNYFASLNLPPAEEMRR